VRLLRHILIAAVLPFVALVLTTVFAPASPPPSAKVDAAVPLVCQTAPAQPASVADRAAGWLHAIVNSTRDLLS
jgi:hypothetical protein